MPKILNDLFPPANTTQDRTKLMDTRVQHQFFCYSIIIYLAHGSHLKYSRNQLEGKAKTKLNSIINFEL